MSTAVYDHEHLSGFVRNFIHPRKRRRYLEKWLDPRWHDRSLDELNYWSNADFVHFLKLDHSPARGELGDDGRNPRLDRVYVISPDPALDNRHALFEEALSWVEGQHSAAVISLLPGRLAYYRSEVGRSAERLLFRV